MHPNTACIRPMSSNNPLGRVSKGPVLSCWLSILNLLHVHIIFTSFIFNTSNGGFLKTIPTKHDQNWRWRSCHIHCSLRTKAGPAATWQNNIQSIESPFYKKQITTKCFLHVYLTLPNSKPIFELSVRLSYKQQDGWKHPPLICIQWCSTTVDNRKNLGAVQEPGWQIDQTMGYCNSLYNNSVLGPA